MNKNKEVKVFQNPFLWTDIPDPDVIRVGNAYYMASTTMHFVPGVPIMKSYDLIHWNIVNYVYDELSDTDDMTLANGKHAYGKGAWAASLRYHFDTYYVSFLAYNTGKTYIYQTKDIEKGPWTHCELDGIYHDLSILFDEDERVFMVYGGGDIKLAELASDLSGVKENGICQTIIENANVAGEGGLKAEGAHIHKINGFYYIFLIAWPKDGIRTEICYRSNCLTGPYEGRIVLCDDMGAGNGVAQGGLIDTPNNRWYAMLFQDTASVGRIPVLVPVEWENDWPVFGTMGKVPKQIQIPLQGDSGTNIVANDEFDGDLLAAAWQWNHNPDKKGWSLAQRPGFLRLTTGKISSSMIDARNTLTQRTYGPTCAASVSIDTSGMKDGDMVGFAAFQECYGFVGVEMLNGKKSIVMRKVESGKEKEVSRLPYSSELVYLKLSCDFQHKRDQASFFYSVDGQIWETIGEVLQMKYTLAHFVGYRFALFYYATENIGGHVDYDYFRLDFPICQ